MSLGFRVEGVKDFEFTETGVAVKDMRCRYFSRGEHIHYSLCILPTVVYVPRLLDPQP